MLAAIIVLLSIFIVSNTVQFVEGKNKEIERIESENRELQLNAEQSEEELNKTKEELEAEKKRADARVKARLALANKNRIQSAYALNTGGVEQWRPLCAKYFGAKVNECLAIMGAESGGVPTKVSKTNDHGLMQLNCSFVGSKGAGGWCTFFGVTKEEIKDPELNVKLARKVYDRSGGSWKQWTTSHKLGLL